MSREHFSPYDLNDVADMDWFIEKRKEEKLLELMRSRSKPPTKGILKPEKSRVRRPILTYVRPQS